MVLRFFHSCRNRKDSKSRLLAGRQWRAATGVAFAAAKANPSSAFFHGSRTYSFWLSPDYNPVLDKNQFSLIIIRVAKALNSEEFGAFYVYMFRSEKNGLSDSKPDFGRTWIHDS